MTSASKAICRNPDFQRKNRFKALAVQNAQTKEEKIREKLQQALTGQIQGNLAGASACYEEILKINPWHVESLQMLGAIATHNKNFRKALDLLNAAIQINQVSASIFNNRGIALKETGQPEAALKSYDKAIDIKNDYALAYSNRGIVLKELNRPQAALTSYSKAIEIKQDYADAYFNRGILLEELNLLNEALQDYDSTIILQKNNADAYYNRGNVLKKLRNIAAALESYTKAIDLKPDHAEAYYNRGLIFNELNNLDDALKNFYLAARLKPDLTEAHYNCGLLLQRLGDPQEALESYRQAVYSEPGNADAHFKCGLLYKELNQPESALASLRQALSIKPDRDYLPGILLQAKMQLCDWTDFEAHSSDLRIATEKYKKASPPFAVLCVSKSPAIQRKAAEIRVNDKYPANPELGEIPRKPAAGKIKIAYFSADFHAHATTYLMAELFELHDRNKFEVIAFSFGPDINDAMRQRVASAFDLFIDVRMKSDKEIAALSREMGIDIAVDLKGHTQLERLGIFSYRAAPAQINYLGYPGTTGADYIDYLIADKILIPPKNRKYFTEKIAYLPGSYQINDSTRKISEKKFTRNESGLPETGCVFCCFNANQKMTPAMFDGWMRILKKVEGSVLWLLEDNALATMNLRKEAIARGVAGERLIFAKKIPMSDNLARQRLADLFLDSAPYGAHTTASDALWVGLPVLTCCGESFASRVAASLLAAMEMPELITTTQAEYERLAIELGRNPVKIAALKAKLEKNRFTTPLFNSRSYTRHIEAAYIKMVDRYKNQLQPDHIIIEA